MDVAAVHVSLRRCMDAGAWTRSVYRPAYMDAGRPMDHQRNQDANIPAQADSDGACRTSPDKPVGAMLRAVAAALTLGGRELRLRPHALPHCASLRAVSGGVTLTLGGRSRMPRIRWCAV